MTCWGEESLSRRTALGGPSLWDVSQDIKEATRRSPLPALCPLGQSRVSDKAGLPEEGRSAGWAGPCVPATPLLLGSGLGRGCPRSGQACGRNCWPVLLPCCRSVGSSALLQPHKEASISPLE